MAWISKVMILQAFIEQEDAEEILPHISTPKINQQINEEECAWDVFAEEILPRLPANQLQTLKTVCRNWYRVIWSPCFVQLHLKIYNQNRIRVLVPPWNSETMIEYKYNNYGEETKLGTPSIIRKTTIKILGSCDGLLCLQRGIGRTIVVYNPSTGTYFGAQFARDFFDIDFDMCWFGQRPGSGEYILVCGNFYCEIGVYKFARGSKLELIHSTSCGMAPAPLIRLCCPDPRRGTLLHGALHWPAQWSFFRRATRYVICVYRLQDNKQFEFSPPVQCDFKLGVVEGCLFAILKPTTNAEFEMWIMKEYGIETSWTKYANIHGFNSYKMLSPLGFFPNGDLILNVDNVKLFKYSFNDDNDDKAVILMNHKTAGSAAIMCADSLVCPTSVYS